MESSIRRAALIRAKQKKVDDLVTERTRAEVQLMVIPFNCSSPVLYRKAKEDYIASLSREIGIVGKEIQDLIKYQDKQVYFEF